MEQREKAPQITCRESILLTSSIHFNCLTFEYEEPTYQPLSPSSGRKRTALASHLPPIRSLPIRLR